MSEAPMSIWNTDQVLSLAPDDASAKAGQGLARPGKWAELGKSEHALWGAIQGSGKDPYRCRVDLTEPAFKCSCPSRKFPCKHGLGLLLILAEHAGAIPQSDPPGWVAEWLSQRAARQESKTARAAEKREVDVEAQVKRAAKREARVEDGVEEVSTWLLDLVRQGLGAAQSQPETYWTAMAARLVDAQAPGLARLVRRLGETASSGEGWQGRLLAGAGKLHLLCEAYRHISSLPPDVQADIRTAIGWNVAKEELLTLPRRADVWCVLAQRVEREEPLRVQRTWLLGLSSAQPALILQFAVGAQAFEQSFRVGTQIPAELVYYPSAVPLRAMLVGERGDPLRPARPLPPAPGLIDALRGYADILARQPWIELWPMRVGGVVPSTDDGSDHLALRDDDGRCLRMLRHFDGQWLLAAVSGGNAIEVFGEWDGEALRPLSVVSDGRLFTFAQAESGTMLSRVA